MPLAHAGGPELLALIVPLVFVIVYRLARGPVRPDLRPPVAKRPPR